ncbi:hypothetical protein [Methanosarcina sp.]|uniref:hypothetical protein n=1 Tax=Methanosarcina sp. TaxID=2213 RepID=UPI003C71B750
MHKLTNFLNKRKQLAFMVASLSVLVLMVTSPAAASVNTWDFSPQKPVCGDTISIKGSASPEDKVDVFVTFEKTVPVSAGKFEYTLEDVKIPGGLNNFFTVEARGAKDLNVRVKMLIWVTKSSEASGNIATVSQSSVPPGTYVIKVDGNANEGTAYVDLKITAFQGIEVDSNGDFSYSYNTKAVPSGDFEIEVGDMMKKVTIEPEGNSNSASDSFFISSSSAKTESSSSKENESSLSPENETSLEPKASETPEEIMDSEILTPDKDLEERKIQAQPSEKTTQKSKLFLFFVDKFYLLIGMGAAILILIIYSRKK